MPGRKKAAAEPAASESVVEVPQVCVACTTPSCTEINSPKMVSAGTVVGDNVIMYGTFACMVCGNNMQIVH